MLHFAFKSCSAIHRDKSMQAFVAGEETEFCIE